MVSVCQDFGLPGFWFARVLAARVLVCQGFGLPGFRFARVLAARVWILWPVGPRGFQLPQGFCWLLGGAVRVLYFEGLDLSMLGDGGGPATARQCGVIGGRDHGGPGGRGAPALFPVACVVVEVAVLSGY